MTKNLKNYPLLISAIVSCAIIIVSLFILGFFGIRLGYTLGGGSQFEIYLDSTSETESYVYQIDNILNKYGLSVDSSFVADKFMAGEEDNDFTQKCLVIQIAGDDVSNEEGDEIRAEIAETLGIELSQISLVESVLSSVASKQVLYLALALGIITIGFFIFGWIRYDIFAGVSFIIAFLHNIILYLSVIILTRVQLTLTAIVIAFMLSVVMAGVLIHIYERFREKQSLKSQEKLSIAEKMANSEKEVVKPYAFIVGLVFLFSILLLFVQVGSITQTSLNIIICLVVTIYTTLIIGPASYSALLEIKDLNEKAILSRNENINKEIKKKVKKNNKLAQN